MPIEWTTAGSNICVGPQEPQVTWKIIERAGHCLLAYAGGDESMELVTHERDGRIVTEVAPHPEDELLLEPSRTLSYPVTRWGNVEGSANTYTYVFSNGSYPNYNGDEVFIEWVRFKIVDRRLAITVGSNLDSRWIDVLDNKGGVHLLGTILYTMKPEDVEELSGWVRRRAHMLKAGLRSVANDLSGLALLLYAGIPLLTQRQSVTACLNLERNYDHAQYVADLPKLDLAGLVKHYYGTAGKKLVATVRENVFTGTDFAKISVDKNFVTQSVTQLTLNPAISASSDIFTPVNSYITFSNSTWETHAISSANSVGVYRKEEDGSLILYGTATISLWPFTILEFCKRMGLPPEDVVQIIDRRESFHHHRTDALLDDATTSFMKLLTRHQVRYLLTEANISHIDDMAREWWQYRDGQQVPERVRTLYPEGIVIPDRWKTHQELHERISAQYRAIQAEANKKDITYDEHVEKLDGMQVRDMTFVLPRCTSKLVEWGSALNICIASFGDKAASKQTLLGAVYRDGKVQYCLEYKMPRWLAVTEAPTNPITAGWKLVQFVKERNAAPDEADREDVVRAMLETVYGAGAWERSKELLSSAAQRFNEQLAAMGQPEIPQGPHLPLGIGEGV